MTAGELVEKDRRAERWSHLKTFKRRRRSISLGEIGTLGRKLVEVGMEPRTGLAYVKELLNEPTTTTRRSPDRYPHTPSPRPSPILPVCSQT